MLKQVVLPAPLGPIKAWIDPARTFSATSSTATKPPNSRVSPAVSRMVSLTPGRLPVLMFEPAVICISPSAAQAAVAREGQGGGLKPAGCLFEKSGTGMTGRHGVAEPDIAGVGVRPRSRRRSGISPPTCRARAPCRSGIRTSRAGTAPRSPRSPAGGVPYLPPHPQQRAAGFDPQQRCDRAVGQLG